VLEVKNLDITYGRVDAGIKPTVTDFEMSLPVGKVVGLVGESGSGKSTIARAITHQLTAPGVVSRGSIKFEDQELVGLSRKEIRQYLGSQISLVVPNPKSELDPLLTIGRQLTDLAVLHLGMTRKEARERAIESLQDVQIPAPRERFGAYPHELSGGMAQRVVIAMSLIGQPQLILSDDATSGLDVTVQRDILDLIKLTIRKGGFSSVFITRDIGVAAYMCDEVHVIKNGYVCERAPTDVFFDAPQHPYSLALLSAFSSIGHTNEAISTDPSFWPADYRLDAPGSALVEVGASHFVRKANG
jgi:ABC-type dipeptide/oligopeptide/nickel transport system ATPase component